MHYSSKYNKFFNWTITYRQDADFRHKYGSIKRIKDDPTKGKDLEAHIKNYGKTHKYIGQNKTKMIAWFVSNCQSQSDREKYAKELQKHIKVKV